MRLISLITLFICLFISSQGALSSPIIYLQDTTESIDLGSSLEILEDIQGELGIDDLIAGNRSVSFQPYHAESGKMIDRNSTFWLRVKIINRNMGNSLWYLASNESYSKSAHQLYVTHSSVTNDSTKAMPIRSVEKQNLRTFPIELNNDVVSTLYLRLSGRFHRSTPWFELKLHTPNSLLITSNMRSLLYALLIGAMLVIGIYNIILFAVLRDFSYAGLSLTIFSTVFLLSNLNGLYTQVTGIERTNFSIFNAVFLLAVVGAMDFSRRIMEAGKYAPKLNRLLVFVQWFVLGSVLVITWMPYGLRLAALLAGTGLILIPIGALMAWRNGLQHSMSLIFIIPVFILSIAPYLLSSQGIIERNSVYLDIYHIGFLGTIILLSFLLAERTREIQESRKIVQATSDAKNLFLANASHELRTPMNAVIGFSHLLNQTTLSEKQHHYVANTLDSSRHMLELIDKILDFSKINVNKLDLTLGYFSLDEVVQAVSAQMEILCHTKNISFELRCDPYIPQQLFGDKLRLRQVLINLTNNAFKFTEQGKIILSVKCLTKLDNKVYLYFSVTDTGIGIDLKKQHETFKPFSQANISHSREYGGAGLGLALSQGIIERMGSTIEIKSRIGKGSQFFFSIWLNHSVMEKHKDKMAVEPAIDITWGKLRPEYAEKTVLLVEDDPLNQLIAQEFLEQSGVNVHAVSSGKEALDFIRTTVPDLVFMDIQMPKMDGYETVRLIRSELGLSSLPIVALTAHTSQDDKKKCLARGMDAFLVKPIQPVELQKVLVDFFDTQLDKIHA